MAFLKTSDLQYEDTQYKQYWSDQYGYDYESNAYVQSQLERMVRDEVSVGVEGMSGREKSLAPRPAEYTHNYTEKFIVTREDIDAYCARFPQVCRVGTKREEAIQKLKSGGTFAPEVLPPETEVPNETVEEPPTTETQEPEEDTSSRSVTPVLPLPPTTPTHKVTTTSGGRLAFRDAPAEVQVSEHAERDTEKKGELIEMLDNGTSYILLDPGVGHQCEWDYVKYNNKVGYVYNKFTSRRVDSAEIVLEYDCDTPVIPAFITPVDWTTKEPGVPYVNEETGKWYVATETEHASTGGAEIENRMLDARYDGITSILSENGKDTSEETITRVVAGLGAVKAEDYYVSPNQGENMRVLVSIPKKYISKIPDRNPEVESEFVDEQTGELASGTFHSELYDSKKPVTRQIILFLNPDNSYKDRVRFVAEGFRGYATQIDKFEGEVKNLDFRKEADRFETLIPKIDSLLTSNNASTAGMHSVEIGLDRDLIPVYGSENSQGYYKQMTSGWDSFADSEPMDSPRTMNYLFYLWDMQQSIQDEMEWTEFVGRYTDFERVEVYPSKSGKDSPADISGMGNESNPSSSGNTAADKADEKISNSDEPDSSCFKETSLTNLAQGKIQRNNNSMKNAAAKLTDDLFLASASVRKSVRDEALATVDFVGDPLVADLVEHMKKIEDLDDVFNVVLNKISLMDLVGAILACFNLELKFDLDLPLPLRFDCLELPTVPTIQFPDNLPTADIMSDLALEIFNAIIQALTQAFVAMLKDLVNSLLDLCKEEEDSQNADINDGIREAAEAASMDQDEADNKAKADKLAILGAAGLLSGDTGGNLTDDEKAQRLAELGDILTDISMLVPPSELCRLLKGKASPRTLSLVRSLLKRKYPDYYKRLQTKTKIKDFLILIGRLVNSEFCDALSRGPRTRHGTDVLCADTDLGNLPEAQALLAKGDGITEDQVLEQLERAQARKKDRSDQIEDLLQKALDLQSGKSNPFEDAIPDLFCGVDASGNPKPGLINLKHDSFDFMLDKVLDTMYAPIYMSFNRDVKSFAPTIVKGTNVKKEIPAAFQSEGEDGKTWMWHPEVKRQEANGITFDFNKDFGEAKSKHGNKMIEVDEGQRQVSPTPRTLLRGLETNGAFVSHLDNEGVYYELILPPDPEMKEAITSLTETLKDALGDAVDDYADFSLDNLAKVMPDWKVRYKMPWQFYDADKGQRVDDEYIIEIFPGTEADSSHALRRTVECDVAEPGREYIQGLFPQENSVYLADETFSWSDLQLTSRVDVQRGRVDLFATREQDPCDPISRNFAGGFEFDPSAYNENITPDAAYSQAERLTGEERCRYIEMYMGKIEIWERLKELYEDSDCWMHSTVKDFHPYMLPPQQSVFGAHVRRVWSQRMEQYGDSNTAEAKSYLDSIESFYSNFVHPQITSDVMGLIAKQIAESKLFDSLKESFPTPNGDMTSSTPYVDKLVFCREPDKIEKACGIDPHMLAIQDFKKAVKEDFENGGGMCSLIAGLEDPSKQIESPLKISMMKSLVHMTVRTHMIDYFLRGIFPFTEFSIEETLDDYILEFMVEKMIAEMLAYEDSYAEEFLKWVVKVGPPDIEDFSDTEPTGNPTDASETPQEPQGVEDMAIPILKKMMLEQFVIIAVEMRDIFDRDSDLQDISFSNHVNLHERLIKEWLPVIDMPEKDGEGNWAPRFADLSDKLSDLEALDVERLTELSTDTNRTTSEQEEYEALYETYSDYNYKTLLEYYEDALVRGEVDSSGKVVRRVEEKTSFDTGKDFDLSNGNMFLEKFFRVVPRVVDTNSLAAKIVEDLGVVYSWQWTLDVDGSTQNLADLAPSQEVMDEIQGDWTDLVAGYFNEALEDAFGEDFSSMEERYFGIGELDYVMDLLVASLYEKINASPSQPSTYSANVAGNSPNDDMNLNSELDKDALAGVVLGTVSDHVWKIDNFFSNIDCGLRLMYVPPVDNSQFKEGGTTTEVSLNEFFDTTSAVIDEPDSTLTGTLDQLFSQYKAFKVPEAYDQDEVGYQEAVSSTQAGETTTTEASAYVSAEATVSRDLYITPLIEVFSSGVFDEIKNQNILELSGWTLDNDVSYWGEKYETSLEVLKESMVETPEYSAIFNYSIPMERFLGLLTVYTIMAVSASPNVETVFSGTKDELHRAFWALSNSSYKAPPSPSNEELARLLEFHVGMSTPCFSFSFGGMPGGMKGFGIDLIVKLAIKTPLAIFKALVEMIDPNIKIAKWILDLAKFVGVCLPMPLISLGLLPPTVFGFPPLGFGIGPPLTPLGFGYLALGFEIPLGNPFGDDEEEEPASSEEAIAECEKRSADKQARIDELLEKILAARK